MVAAVALAVPAAGAPWVDALAAPNRVVMADANREAQKWAFEPGALTVKAGSTVVWNNQGRQRHTVAAKDGSFDSPSVAPGETWRWKFSAPGEFAYHCKPHPWMNGSVRVVR